MIRSWRNAASRKVWQGGRPNRFAGLDTERALLLLDVLDAASTLEPIAQLRSAGLHALKGSRRGQWAITVNARWRICFRFEEGDAHDVEIVDYHKG
jgi:proteic killer suppression protein